MNDIVKCDGSGDCSDCQFDDCPYNDYWDDLPDEWFDKFGDFMLADTILF